MPVVEPDPSDTAAFVARLAGGTAEGQSRLEELRTSLVGRAAAEGLVDLSFRTIDSPYGALLLAGSDVGLVRVAFALEGFDRVLADLAAQVGPRVLRNPAPFDAAARQLDEYFAGARQEFDLPLDLRLVRGFRLDAVSALAEVPYGTTESYTALAARAGRPAAVRAAASACANNPVPIVVPCHRIVRSDGTIGRYLGGSDVKAALIAFELDRDR